MGLFEVSGPLLYGEGDGSAFARLQLEILRKSGDESIFAFQNSTTKWGHVLADSPSRFAHALGIRVFEPTIPRKPYTFSNKGLEVTTVLLRGRLPRHVSEKIYYMHLNCAREGALQPIAVPLRRIERGV